jgi:division/cell wall cluster transcriptional repressor MraZ
LNGSSVATKGTTFGSMYLLGMDSKNRIVLPADYRAVIAQREGEPCDSVALECHATRICLRGYEPKRIDAVEAAIEARFGPEMSDARDEAGAFAFAGTEVCGIDSAGRVLLAEQARNHMELAPGSRQLLFIGGGSHFMIWNPLIAERDFNLNGLVTRFLNGQKFDRGAA